MERRNFLKCAAGVATGALASRAGLAASFTSGVVPRVATARMGIFFPHVALLKQVQQKPARDFVCIETAPGRYSAAMRLPLNAVECDALMSPGDVRMVRDLIAKRLSGELGVMLRWDDAKIAFFHPYTSNARSRVVCCEFTIA